MPATPHQWLRVHSRATDACLFYLDRVIGELERQPLLNDFGRSLEKNGLRRPLSVEPYDAARFRDRRAQEERERNNVSIRTGDADVERRLYAHRSGMDDQLREERAEPESLDPLLDTLEVAMLLGDPGSGKSECLKGLAVRSAKSIRDELHASLKLPDEIRLPVFAEMPAVARLFGEEEEKSQLRAFVRDWLMPLTPDGPPSQEPPPLDNKTRLLAAILKAATTRLNLDKADMEACTGALRRIWQDWFSPTSGLSHGSSAMILLDAWDEIAESHRTDEFKRALCALSERPPVRLITTSRILGFEAGILDAPPSAGPGAFRRTLVILPFCDNEVTEFIKAFFAKSKTANQLIQDIATKQMVMGMIQNPLLATLVCLAFDPSAPHPVPLPARRTQVYQAVVDRLLGEAEARRKARGNLKKEAALQIQGILQSLAFHFFPDEVFSEAKVADFCEKRRPRSGTALARHLSTFRQTLFDCLIASGLLVRHGADELRFLHLTFQEFFAASFLARAVEQQGWDNAEVRVRGIARPVMVRVIIDKKGWHPRWQEVIALTAGQLDPAEAPVEPLLETLTACQDSIHHHRLCLAVRCLAEASVFDRSETGTAARIGMAASKAWLATRGLDWTRRDEVCADKNVFRYLVEASVPVGNQPSFIMWAASFLKCLSNPEFHISALVEQVKKHPLLHQSDSILEALLEVLRQRSHSEDVRWAVSKALQAFGDRACIQQFLDTMQMLLQLPTADARVLESENRTLLKICTGVTPMSFFRVGISRSINLSEWLGVSPLARSDELARMLLAVLRDKTATDNQRWRAAVVICYQRHRLFVAEEQWVGTVKQLLEDTSESESLRRKIVITLRDINDESGRAEIRQVVSTLAEDMTIGSELRESASRTMEYIHHPLRYTRSDFDDEERASELLRKSIRKFIDSQPLSHLRSEGAMLSLNRPDWLERISEVVDALDDIFNCSSSSDEMKMSAALIRRAIGLPVSADQETELLRTVLGRVLRRGDMSSATSQLITQYDLKRSDAVTSALEAILLAPSISGHVRATAAAGLRRSGICSASVLDALAQTPRDGFEWLILSNHGTIRWFDHAAGNGFLHSSVEELAELPETGQPES